MWPFKKTSRKAHLDLLQAMSAETGLPDFGHQLVNTHEVSYPNQPDKPNDYYVTVTYRVDEQTFAKIKETVNVG